MPGTGGFRTLVTSNAGGWYKLSVDAYAGGVQIGNASVDRVGVGEIFVVAGQSNSANWGQALQTGTDLTSTYDPVRKRWGRADDPMPGADGSSGSPWPIFASRLSTRLALPVAVISVGCGGTSVTDWLPQMSADQVGAGVAPSASAIACTSTNADYHKNLYARLRDSLNSLGPQGARAVFWHQGESDTVAGLATNDYEYRLAFIVNQLNIDSNSTWNYLVARASYFPGNDVDAGTCSWTGAANQYAENAAKIRAAQINLTNRGLAYAGPDTDTFWGGQYRYSPGCVHFNANGLNVHAQSWLDALSATHIVPGL